VVNKEYSGMNETIVLDKPEQIYLYRLSVLKAGLKLEKMGLKRGKGPSCYSQIKHEFGLKGSMESVYTQFCEFIEKERGRLGY
jgi:hypothetical protein